MLLRAILLAGTEGRKKLVVKEGVKESVSRKRKHVRAENGEMQEVYVDEIEYQMEDQSGLEAERIIEAVGED